MRIDARLGGLALLSLMALGGEAVAEAGRDLFVDRVRAATYRFQDVSAAVAEGYAPTACVSGIDGGAKGVAYVNPTYLDDAEITMRRPQTVLYEPMPDGRMVLVAVQYMTSRGPTALGGQLFSFNAAPNRYGRDPFYDLHVWAWKANPRGTFAAMNPDVTCAHGK